MDAFVLVACPENSLGLDSREYLKPVVTPFELDLALNKDREWSGGFVANFQVSKDNYYLLPFQCVKRNPV